MTGHKFKVGDEVIVLKNLGNMGGYRGEFYYYGGTVNVVPLNSSGKVIRVYDSLAYNVQISDGIQYNFLEEELTEYDQINLVELNLQGFKEIGRHPLFEMAEQAKLFLLNKKVYSVNENDEAGVLAENYFQEIGKTKKSVIEVGELSSLEELMLARFYEQIVKTKENYAEKVKKDMEISQVFDTELTVPQLIFKYVFPYLRKKEYENKISRFFGDEKNIGKEGDLEKFVLEKKQKFNSLAEGLLEKINERIEKIELEKFREDAEESRAKFIDELISGEQTFNALQLRQNILGEKNIAVIDGKLYDLISDFKQADSVLNVENKNYALQKSSSSPAKLEKSFKFNLAKKMKMDALREYFAKERFLEFLESVEQDNLKATMLAGKFEGRDNYSEEDFGLVKYENKYYVCLDVPAFAVKSAFDGNYYFFEKTQVAVRVFKKNNSLGYLEGACVTKNNNNPILHPHRGISDFYNFCLGSNDLPDSGKDIGEIIAKRLKKAKDIMLYGYLKPLLTCDQLVKVCSGCKQSHFKKNIMPLSELQKMGVQMILEGQK